MACHVIVSLLISYIGLTNNSNDSKRLLLNDPTIFQDRLNRMESMLTILQNTVKQQTVTIQQQDSKIQQQADAISKLTSSSKGTSNKLNYSYRIIRKTYV
jgi:hypothetical protein